MPEITDWTLEQWSYAAGLAALALGAAGLVYVLILRSFDAARARYGMPAADRREWERCHTLHDVAVCTARWLTGELRGQPGYCGPVDVDEDDAPGLTAALIACNEAGFLTTGSQAGIDVIDGNDRWTQLAAVDGHVSAETLHRLLVAVEGTGVKVWRTGKGKTVTWRNDRPYTTFGSQRRDLGDSWTGYGMCHPDAVGELEVATPVVVFDPEAGRNDRLLSALGRFAEMSRGVEFNTTTIYPKDSGQ